MSETPVSLLDRLQGQPTPADWQRFVDLYEPLLRGWLGRDAAVRNEADDLIQDILKSLVQKLPDFRRQRAGSFRRWLRVITVNRVNLYWRQRRGQPLAEGGNGAEARLAQLEDPDSPVSRLWDEEHNRHVLRRLLQLIEPEFAEKTWRAFRRHVLDGAPTAAVAAELGTSEGAVLIARCRILKRLREEARGLVDEAWP